MSYLPTNLNNFHFNLKSNIYRVFVPTDFIHEFSRTIRDNSRCKFFDSKFLFQHLKMVGWWFEFNGISTLVGYLMPNHFMQIVQFQTIQFSISTQFKCKYSLIMKNTSISSYSVQ